MNNQLLTQLLGNLKNLTQHSPSASHPTNADIKEVSMTCVAIALLGKLFG
ncbi:MAG: hypothetical protein SAK29_13745 [Scytonema sp. PMC 1069.18]|nr:hypothetical protein [Scytonema sp. PMC 1069.18]MEC4886110.1 hypothetical protein [Scytonema sp. PMC 1070.18]